VLLKLHSIALGAKLLIRGGPEHAFRWARLCWTR
jgi:hypothetical protein